MTEHKGKIIIEPELSIDEINERIENEFCSSTLSQLSDENLMDDYKECKSVINEIQKLESILDNNSVDKEKQKKIINEYLIQLIPPGTKGVIRGNKFNKILKNYIENLQLDKERFKICFEKKSEEHFTTEIPDWYILEKQTNKIIIGMNQLDLWGG